MALLNEFQFQLTIAGPHESEILSAIDPDLLKARNLKTTVVGPVSDRTIVTDLYKNHDLVCVPSESEALGLVNAEAIAHGLSVVGTRVGGIPEVLGDGEYGYLSSNPTRESLASAIRNCIMNSEETNRKVTAAREFVIRRFGSGRLYQDLYSTLKTIQDSTASHGLPKM